MVLIFFIFISFIKNTGKDIIISQFALNGYAYALIPAIDIAQELKQKKLINLFPDKTMAMPLYWHTWSIESKTYKRLNDLVQDLARRSLRQPADKK